MSGLVYLDLPPSKESQILFSFFFFFFFYFLFTVSELPYRTFSPYRIILDTPLSLPHLCVYCHLHVSTSFLNSL
ncbi:hypothetical protein BDV36DRAFT_227288 [Aspergillus pseudocaelatus]|uniref:Uncharacterized protein n=1 Tax=Aspergillus pseudocaelatus TaxID=1825620 RepID=A0ABQ6WES7_9EURO|nr:hypothetical protein BDV36DRAFT_227288 [Aspergillus pseudocaelatus]